MKIKNKPLKYAIAYTIAAILSIPIILWIMSSVGLFYLGSSIRYLGNWMTGFRLDKSVGSVFLEKVIKHGHCNSD